MFMLVFALFSCKSIAYRGFSSGKYSCNGNGFQFSLILHSDSTYELNKQFQDRTINCTGSWDLVTTDTIRLTPMRVGAIEEIISGYDCYKERRAVIINSKKLRLEGNTFRKLR